MHDTKKNEEVTRSDVRGRTNIRSIIVGRAYYCSRSLEETITHGYLREEVTKNWQFVDVLENKSEEQVGLTCVTCNYDTLYMQL